MKYSKRSGFKPNNGLYRTRTLLTSALGGILLGGLFGSARLQAEPTAANNLLPAETPHEIARSPLQQSIQTYAKAAAELSAAVQKDTSRNEKIEEFNRLWLSNFIKLLAAAPKDDPGRYTMLSETGAIFYSLGDVAASLRSYEQAEASVTDPEAKAQSARMRASLTHMDALSHLKEAGKITAADECFAHALSCFAGLQGASATQSLAGMLLDHAALNKRLGKNGEALDDAKRAAQLLKASPPLSPSHQLDEALHLVATLAARQQDTASMYEALGGLARLKDARYDLGYYVSQCADLLDPANDDSYMALLDYGIKQSGTTGWGIALKLDAIERQVKRQEYKSALRTFGETKLDVEALKICRPQVANPSQVIGDLYFMVAICLDKMGDHTSAAAVHEALGKGESKHAPPKQP